MALNTPIAALPYPELTDIPNAQTAFSNLTTALDNQVVPRFATGTARDAAITTPVDGQLAVRQEYHELDHYNGGVARWAPVGNVVFGEQIMANSTTITVTFNSIPQTCRHLLLVVAGHSAQVTFESTFNMTWNNLTGANYNNMRQDMTTSASNGSFTSGQTSTYAGSLPGTSYSVNGMGVSFIEFPFYSNTSFNKVAHFRTFATDGGATANYHIGASEYGNDHSAITRVDLTIGATGFSVNTFFGLYGWG